MYVIDLNHILDDRGAIAPEKGPARKMADFLAAVVAHASDFERADDAPGPLCFKCRKRDRHAVDTGITDDDAVVWRCAVCGTEGRISNWQRSFWDLTQGRPSN
jgi:hypothetical protein